MPTFPWRRLMPPDADRRYIALLGLVQLASIKMLPAFLTYGARIEYQLRHTPGVIGYRMRSELLRLRFYHLSVWTDRSAIHEFVRELPHAQAMRNLYGRLGLIEFRYWEVSGSDVPLSYEKEMDRLSRVQ